MASALPAASRTQLHLATFPATYPHLDEQARKKEAFKSRRITRREVYACSCALIYINCDIAVKSYAAEVPEPPGCMADGSTYQEALANAEQIIREWIETASDLGRALPKPRERLAYA